MFRKLAPRVPVQAPVPGKKHQCDEKTPPAGGFRQFFSCLFTFFQAEGKEFTDVFLVLAPEKHLAGKEIDNGNGKHIADDADGKRFPIRKTHSHSHNDSTPQFDKRYHGNEEDQKIFMKHLLV